MPNKEFNPLVLVAIIFAVVVLGLFIDACFGRVVTGVGVFVKVLGATIGCYVGICSINLWDVYKKYR